MGFVWTEDISVGASIDVADIAEIRTNVDTVDNEMCAADKVNYNSDYKDGDDTTHNPGYYSNQHGNYENGDLSGYDSTYDSGYYSDQHTIYLLAFLSGVDDDYFPGYQNDYNSYYKGAANLIVG